MVLLVYLVLLVALGIIAMQALQLGRDRSKTGTLKGPKSGGPMIDGTADSPATPAAAVAQTMADLETAQAALRTAYPTLARMLGGYLHAEAVFGADSLEAVVKDMVLDWQPESKAITDDIARVLADNSEESAVRAVVKSFCAIDLEEEGYRSWLIWLQGQFNPL
ncbi:MAG: hypothetical protein AAFR20_03090 [Pseudomonadota bacterium]